MDERFKCESWNCKTFRRKIGINLLVPELGNSFLVKTPNIQATKEKNKLYFFKKIFNNSVKGYYQEQKRKTTYRIGKNICKSHIW